MSVYLYTSNMPTSKIPPRIALYYLKDIQEKEYDKMILISNPTWYLLLTIETPYPLYSKTKPQSPYGPGQKSIFSGGFWQQQPSLDEFHFPSVELPLDLDRWPAAFNWYETWERRCKCTWRWWEDNQSAY